MTEVSKTISTQAAAAPDNPTFRKSFELQRPLPSELAALDRISLNFYWSWHLEGSELFRTIDSVLWEKCEQNPRVFLNSVSNLLLRQRAADPDYVARLRDFDRRLSAEMQAESFPSRAKAAYFCAEYGVHQSLPNYSGGLGILAGDHLKSASDLATPLVAIGLLYRYGYFRQSIDHDGWQQERYNDIFESDLALTPVYDELGERVTVCVHIRGREVTTQAWKAQIGRIPLYLLDTNLPQNEDVDRLITGHLYGGDAETRIVQEKVLGIGGVRLLRRLGCKPDVYHLNEGHAAFSTLELVSEMIASDPALDFADAAALVREKCVFTTHTPVAAGNDEFQPKLLRECFSDEFIASLKLTDNEFLALGRADLTDDDSLFGMTPLAIRMCRSANGVSKKHGEVSRGLWHKMFKDAATPENVPIGSVTNGVHAPTWVANSFQRLFESSAGTEWNKLVLSPNEWSSMIRSLDPNDIRAAHQSLKSLLIAFIRNRTRAKNTGDVDTINEHLDTAGLFKPDVLTIGFARRVAAYKRWDLLFSDMQRLLRLVDHAERPVQFVFAGKAHPQDQTAKKILQKLMTIDHDSTWQQRAVFIEDYDQEVARYLVRGVDVWLNVPRRPMEASGTSGMKAAMNGVLNASILDGWWIEGFDGSNGFAIGGESNAESDDATDAADALELYRVIEDEIVPAYYETDDKGHRTRWNSLMVNSIASLTPAFSSDRMVADYIREIYRFNA